MCERSRQKFGETIKEEKSSKNSKPSMVTLVIVPFIHLCIKRRYKTDLNDFKSRAVVWHVFDCAALDIE